MRGLRGDYERVLNFDNQSGTRFVLPKSRWHRISLGMTALQVTKQEARRIAVRAALLNADRPDDVVGLVHKIAMLRVELTNTVAPAADHICWSRPWVFLQSGRH